MINSSSRTSAEIREARRKQRKRSSVIQFFALAAGAVATALFLNTFVTSSFSIPSTSMTPTLEVGDRVMVNKLVPDVMALRRGDIIVFEDPSNWLSPADKQNGVGYLIKRVIAIKGDTITCCDDNGYLLLNGEPLLEPYIDPNDVPSEATFDETVPPGYVWVMGDDRNNSLDSRFQGNSQTGKFVPLSSVVGKAFFIMAPFNRWSII